MHCESRSSTNRYKLSVEDARIIAYDTDEELQELILLRYGLILEIINYPGIKKSWTKNFTAHTANSENMMWV